MKANQKIETTLIGRLIENTFSGPAWHGPSLLETIQEIPATAALRKSPATHRIIELVLHMAVWRNFVTRRLLGDNAFEVSDQENFPQSEDWGLAIEIIKKSQTDLLDALKKFPIERLAETVPSRGYDFYTMLHGIIQHDTYHIGQVVLLKKQFE